MSQAQQLRVLDEQQTHHTDDDADGSLEATIGDVDAPATTLFDRGNEIDLREQFDRRPRRFVEAVAREVNKGDRVRDVRRLDELDTTATDDVDMGVLLVFDDESVMFVGSDPTTRDSVPLFAFLVERHEPIPAPTSARDALDLLRPVDVRDAFADNDDPDRQGEWWLLPTDRVPVGSTYRPGLESRPFGPSPLGNHVPREYGFDVSDTEFMTDVRGVVPELPESIKTPPTAIRWIYEQRRKTPTPEFAPDWGTIREIAGEIYVRGTLRHRENDHYVERLGDDWHRAITHDMDVFTGDDYLERVVVD